MPLETIILGENVDYFGKKAMVIREIYQEFWKFIVIVDGKRLELMTH